MALVALWFLLFDNGGVARAHVETACWTYNLLMINYAIRYYFGEATREEFEGIAMLGYWILIPAVLRLLGVI